MSSCVPLKPKELVPNTSWDYLYEPEAEEVLGNFKQIYRGCSFSGCGGKFSLRAVSKNGCYEISF